MLPSTENNPSAANGEADSTSQTSYVIKKRRSTVSKINDIDSLSKLNFDTFKYTDMNKLQAKIVSTNTKVFGATDYIVELHISNIPPFKVPKRFNEFNAFHQALSLRFNNVTWPPFPDKFQIMNKTETRKKALNLFLDKIIELLRSRDSQRKTLLGIFFAFFIDTETVQRFKMAITTKKPDAGKKGGNEEDDEAAAKRLQEMFNQAINQYDAQPFDLDMSIDSEHSAGSAPHNQTVMNTLITPEETKIQLDKDQNQNPETPREELKDENYQNTPIFTNKNSIENLDESHDSPKEYLLMDQPGSLESRSRLKPLEDEDIARPRTNGVHSISEVILNGENNAKSLDNGLIENKEASPPEETLLKPTKSAEGSPTKASILDPPTNAPVLKPPSQKTTSLLSGLKNSYNSFVNKNQKQQTQKQQDIINATPNQSIHGKVTYLPNTAETLPLQEISPLVNHATRSVDHMSIIANATIQKKMEEECLNFAGTIYMRLSSEKNWNKYYGKVIDSFILLYKDVLDNHQIHTICCYLANLNYVNDERGEYIELFHYYDSEKIEICIDPTMTDQHDTTDPKLARNIDMWLSQIKFATKKGKNLMLDKIKYNPIGKCQIVISDLKGIKGIPPNSACFARVRHLPYSMRTHKVIGSENIEFKESFFLPITDPFFPMSIEIVGVFNDGWITEHHKEEILCTGEIATPDIISLSKSTILTCIVNLRYTEARRKLIYKTPADNDIPEPILRVKIKNLSSIKSFFAPETKDYREGIIYDTENYSKQYMKLGFKRIYRIINQWKILMSDLNDIYHFKYPVFSYFCLILFITIILKFDAASFLTDFIILMVIFSIYQSPVANHYILGFLNKYLFDDSHLNPFYQKPRVSTVADQEILKLQNTSKWKEKFRDGESIVTTFKKAKKSLATMTIILNSVSNSCEKFKNILYWEDPIRTLMFLGFMMFTYCLLCTIGLRILILLFVIMKFVKGINYYKKIYPQNKEMARLALFFVVKRYFSEHFNAIQNINQPWPITLNFNSFQRKLIPKILEQFLLKLSIVLPEDALVLYKTPEELLNAIATCPRLLNFAKEASDEMMLDQIVRKEPKFSGGNILNLIMNAPSDYYRVLHPKINSGSQ